ncbi:hypothetical protein niasHT_035330 [Heterodera trifolii]|uniref:Uncharacterized protein n=1 Tax=Heterodera trifolii TaxID=157864 RepID=A0ABD2HXJ2_9BILA
MSDLIEPDKVRKFWPQLEVIGMDKALVCDKKTSDFSMEIPLLLEEGVGDEKGQKADKFQFTEKQLSDRFYR